ncbi:hypothetical protein DXG01_010306 [Tephrocybe rancida]|nr:hypothetical protein DXG01_010306 [Tephrocybe rancida]
MDGSDHPIRVEVLISFMTTLTTHHFFGPRLRFLDPAYYKGQLENLDSRLSVQPAFIYAIISAASCCNSQHLRSIDEQQQQYLLTKAEEHLEYEIQTGNIDISLCEAALLIALIVWSPFPLKDQMPNVDVIYAACRTLTSVVSQARAGVSVPDNPGYVLDITFGNLLTECIKDECYVVVWTALEVTSELFLWCASAGHPVKNLYTSIALSQD